MKKVCLTGIKPTGNPHLGNYLGAIRPAIRMAQSGEFAGYYFIADYHSLTAVHNGKELSQYIYEVAATWMAFGLDPKQVVLYQQSHIPEVMELHWILSCFTAKGHMNRAHAYKAMVQENENSGRDPDLGVNIGLYTYPVLMSADILLLQSDVVPVGPDQLQHLEIAREIAQSFNFVYGDLLKLPKALEQNVPLIPGLDGRKMSKSYQNTIPLFANEKDLRKLLNKIKTDSLPPEAPKNPDESLIFTLYKFFATPYEIENLKAWYLRGIGWGDAKAQLFEVINRELQLPRQRYQELISNRSEIDRILNEGAERVRSKAQDLLKKIKKTIGVI
ncbi:MAG: tryptophan--tRNA ligase [Bdellovibrionales bacterium GWA2_49_15]|nr:MAG: tryptophan--tRNA ligase [Bdellovibrionales bacterium GWA2_49_15]HAZ12121.1 tryptophan--tRNA ligase [Bdellovibrionales bacterium]